MLLSCCVSLTTPTASVLAVLQARLLRVARRQPLSEVAHLHVRAGRLLPENSVLQWRHLTGQPL